jgi:hypothetical protein
MPRKPKPKPDNPEEFKRFIDMAREVEADESPDALDRALNKVIRSRSAPHPSAPRNRKRPKKAASNSLEKRLRAFLPH